MLQSLENWLGHLRSGAVDPMVVLGVLLPAIFLLVGYRAKASSGRKRSLSFTSAVMVKGSYPTECTVPAPVINAVMWFKSIPSQEGLEEVCQRCCHYANFNSVPVDVGHGKWVWEKLQDQHINYAELVARRSAKDYSQVLEELEEVKDRPLPTHFTSGHKRPFFELLAIDNQAVGEDSAAVLRIHHCIGDGMSLVAMANYVLRSLDGEVLDLGKPFARREKDIKPGFGIYKKVFKSLWEIVTLGQSQHDSLTAFTAPDKAHITYKTRKTAFMPDLPLTLVKRLKDAAEVTVNDVLLSLTSGAVRRYCQGRGDSLDAKTLRSRVLLPVALPRSTPIGNPDRALRNKWVFVSSNLHLAEPSPAKRLRKVHGDLEGLKNSPTAMLQLMLQNAVVSRLPVSVARKMVYDTFSRHTMIFSNVPGPQEPVMFARTKVTRMDMLFPNLIPQVGILSYAGAVHLNIVVDPEIVTDHTTLGAFFVDELKELCAELKVEAEAEIAAMRKQADVCLQPGASSIRG